MENKRTDNIQQGILIIIGIFIIVSIYNSCHDKAMKARAFEKMQENPGMKSEEAIEEAEIEHEEALDAMDDNY
jgi:hypothetical protein